MIKRRILVVEDEDDIREVIRYNLEKAGLLVSGTASGEEALELARRERPDLVLLDLMLPGMDGLDVCRQLKKDPATAAIPVVMLTARSEDADIVTGLEIGAQNYLTKPFSPRVLVARIRAALRKDEPPPAPDTGIIRTRDLVIDPGRHQVLVKGKPVDLTFTEFRVLQLLAGRPGWVFSRYQIINAVRGEDYIVTDRAVDVQVAGLRRKLGAAGRLIETVRGVGYRFQE